MAEHPGHARRRRRRGSGTGWPSRTGRPGSPTPNCSTRRGRSVRRWWRPASSPATGWPSGPSTAPSGWWPCSAARSGRGRARPGQHAVQGRRGGGHPGPEPGPGAGHRHRFPRDRLRRDAAVHRRCAARSGHDGGRPRSRHRTGPSRGLGSSVGPRTPGGPIVDQRRWRVGPDDPSDILFTSGTTGLPKGVVMTHGRTLCVATDWVAMTGLVADDRYLMVNPYFHMFGLKAGILACVASGATMLPEAVFDVDRVLGRVERERVTVLPGSPTLYQAILDHPERGESRPVQPAGGGDRCGRHPGRAHPPHERRAAVLDDHHRLRAHRGGHGRGDGPGRRRRDHRHHGRAAPSRFRDPHRRRRRGRRARRAARRGGAARRERHGRLPRRPGGDAACALRRRVVADRRHRPGRPGRVSAHRRSGQGHVHRRRLQRLSRRDRECPVAPSRYCAGGGDRRRRRPPGRGRHGLRRHGDAGPHRPDIIGWCRDQMANYKVPRARGAGRRAAGQRHRKGDEGRPARAGGTGTPRRWTGERRCRRGAFDVVGPAGRRAGRLGGRAVGGRPAGRLGRRRHKGRGARGRPHAPRVRLAGDRQRHAEPGLLARQPGQAQRRAGPAPARGPGAPGGPAGVGGRLHQQSAARRPRRTRPGACGHRRPPPPSRVLQHQWLRPAR